MKIQILLFKPICFATFSTGKQCPLYRLFNTINIKNKTDIRMMTRNRIVIIPLDQININAVAKPLKSDSGKIRTVGDDGNPVSELRNDKLSMIFGPRRFKQQHFRQWFHACACRSKQQSPNVLGEINPAGLAPITMPYSPEDKFGSNQRNLC